MSVSWFLLVIGTSVLPSAVIVYSRRMLVNGIANDAPLMLAIRAVDGISMDDLSENEKEHRKQETDCE